MHNDTDRKVAAAAIAHVRTLAALHGAEWPSYGARQTLEGSVQVLLDLGLSDEAIAAYLLRFGILRIHRSNRQGVSPSHPDRCAGKIMF